MSYYHTDALGSPVAKTNASKSVIETSEYEPYGKLLNRANDDRAGYTGHVMDAASGLTYMQQRYYDPQIGRFLSVDPVTAYEKPMTNFNRYAYAFNNPYRFTDPDGRDGANFYTGQYQMAPPDPATARATIGLIADFLPVIGDIKGVVEAIQNPTVINVVAAGVGFVPIAGDVAGKALKHADEAISMTKAVEKGAAHVGSDAKVALTPAGNVQFSSSTVDAAGNTVTKNARFDVNPNSGHVQKQGPHLNLETQIKSPSGQVTKLPDPHTPIKPETIRRGDYE
ncbi:MAG: hypothetical protein KGL71_00955 [Xanthomonadaceae bacterium]|nr:hypothetical protein [Xanthomonadaceae bacterium]